MRKRNRELNKVDDVCLGQFLEYRRHILTQARGNILEPSNDDRVMSYAPFDHPGYAHRELLEGLGSDAWGKIMDSDPKELVSPDPFMPSKYRKHSDGRPAFAIWDAAVGVPACRHRTPDVVNMYDIPIVRSINTHWKNTALPALQRVGPLGRDNEIVRPYGPWIYDITTMEGGWTLLEAAHVLAHLQGDTRADSRKFGFADSKTSGHWRAELAKLLVALEFDIPIDTMPGDYGKPGTPDFPSCGLEVKTSSWFDAPYMRAPWASREALRFDETLALMVAGVYIEPHPYGHTSATMQWRPRDRWSCAPTIVALAGWDAVDVITHQPLVSVKPENRSIPVCYGEHPYDLMPPQTLWAYLALCRRRGLLKEPEQLNEACAMPGRYRYVYDWLNSKAFTAALMRTPPLPCKYCSRPNAKAEKAPRRPKGKVPTVQPKLIYGKAAEEWQAWETYNAAMEAIRGIIQRAVEPFEARRYGGRLRSNRIRRQRNSGYKARMSELSKQRKLKRIIAKKKQGKHLTRNQIKLYREYTDNIRERKGHE